MQELCCSAAVNILHKLVLILSHNFVSIKLQLNFITQDCLEKRWPILNKEEELWRTEVTLPLSGNIILLIQNHQVKQFLNISEWSGRRRRESLRRNLTQLTTKKRNTGEWVYCHYIDNLDLLILLQNGDFSSSLWDWANQKHGKHNSAVRFNSRHRHLTGKSHKLISFHLNILMTGSVDWKTLNIGRILITKIVKMMCCHMIVNDLKALCYRYSILFILWLINLNVKIFLNVDFKRLHNISTHIYNL